MELIAGKKCVYRGRKVPEGERFEAARQYARALIAMKRARPAPATAPATYSHRAIRQTQRVDMVATPLDHDGKNGGSKSPEQSDELAATRAEYTEKLGKRFFPGWSAEQLREKIAAHEQEVSEEEDAG